MTTHKIAVRFGDSFLKKLRGLSFTKAEKIEPLYFKTRFGIHTFGLRASIDLLIIDNNDEVVLSKVGVTPNRLVFWPIRYNRVVELPSGFINERNIRLGDSIELIESSE